jgi:hypothetical protein
MRCGQGRRLCHDGTIVLTTHSTSSRAFLLVPPCT